MKLIDNRFDMEIVHGGIHANRVIHKLYNEYHTFKHEIYFNVFRPIRRSSTSPPNKHDLTRRIRSEVENKYNSGN